MQLQVADEQLVHAAGVTGREAVEFTLSGGEGGVRQGDGWGGGAWRASAQLIKTSWGKDLLSLTKTRFKSFIFFFFIPSSFQIVAAPCLYNFRGTSRKSRGRTIIKYFLSFSLY